MHRQSTTQLKVWNLLSADIYSPFSPTPQYLPPIFIPEEKGHNVINHPAYFPQAYRRCYGGDTGTTKTELVQLPCSHKIDSFHHIPFLYNIASHPANINFMMQIHPEKQLTFHTHVIHVDIITFLFLHRECCLWRPPFPPWQTLSE